MHRRMTAVPIFILLIVGMLVAWLAPVAATQEGSAKILRINAGDFFPETFDPQLSDNGQSFFLIDFEGLTRIDDRNDTAPVAHANGRVVERRELADQHRG